LQYAGAGAVGDDAQSLRGLIARQDRPQPLGPRCISLYSSAYPDRIMPPPIRHEVYRPAAAARDEPPTSRDRREHLFVGYRERIEGERLRMQASRIGARDEETFEAVGL
jgi:hypothetical protein